MRRGEDSWRTPGEMATSKIVNERIHRPGSSNPLACPMRLIDLSQPVYHDSPNCPAHPPVKSEVIKDHPDSGWRVELLTLASHTGSHVDAPLHKIAGGARLDDIPLEAWCGPAYVADFRGVAADAHITADMLKAKLPANLAGAI